MELATGRSCTAGLAAFTFAAAISFAPFHAQADSGGILTKAVENVLGPGWIPLVPPKDGIRLGVPALVKSRSVVLICPSAATTDPKPQKAMHDVRLDFLLSGGVRLELLFGKGFAKWLLEAGLIGDVSGLSRISATIEKIEQREVSVIELRRLEQQWSADCKSAVKDEWKGSLSKPFSVMAVSYWSNTRIQAYDSSGTLVALSAKPKRIAQGKLEASIQTEDRYSVRIPGLRAVAVRPWPLRQRIVDLAGESSIVEVDSQPFGQADLDALYLALEGGSQQ